MYFSKYYSLFVLNLLPASPCTSWRSVPLRGYGASWLDGNAARLRRIALVFMFVCSLQTDGTAVLEETVEQNNGPHGEAVVPNSVSINVVSSSIKQHVVVMAVMVVSVA